MQGMRAFAIVTGTLLTWASAASAQPSASPGQDAKPPESSSSRTASDIEAGATWLGSSNSKFAWGMDCGRAASIKQRLVAEANAYQRLGNGFSKFGDVLTMTTAIAQVAQGKHEEAAKTVGNAAFDKALCAVFGPLACATWASWNAGTAFGGLIRDLPLSGGRTIGDIVDDQWLSWLGPYIHQPLNLKNMEAAFAEFQRRQADLKRRQREADEFGGQCKAKEEAEKRKSAVEEMLKKAKPPAVRSSSGAGSYAEDLFGQSAAEAADPYASQRLADEQNRKLNEVDAIMQENNVTTQGAADAIWRQGLDSLSAPAPAPLSPPTTYSPPTSQQPSGNSGQRRCIASVEKCAEILNMTVEEYLRYDPPR